MRRDVHASGSRKVLMLASVASMIDQFNMPNIELLLKMGYEVHILCNFKEGNTCTSERISRLQQKLSNMHAVWHPWDCPRSIWPVKKCVRAYRQLLKLVDRQCFSWIHCHSPIGGALARFAAHKRGIRIIYTAHGFHFYRGAPLKNWLMYYPAEKLLAHWTDVLITVNREDYCFARRRLKAGRVCYIPGIGIDVEKFRAGMHGSEKAAESSIRSSEKIPSNAVADAERQAGRTGGRIDREFSRKYQIPAGAAVLLSVGELNKGKNHRMAIEALAKLARSDVYYIICGQGPLRAQLQQYAGRLGVGRYLRLPGYQEDMPWIYQNADIFIFPSKREGMPVALMEAMAAGLPCVASDIRGNRELVEKRMLFSLKKPQQLADRLSLLLEDSCLREDCSRYAWSAVKKCDQKAVIKWMRKIYKSMDDAAELSDVR